MSPLFRLAAGWFAQRAASKVYSQATSSNDEPTSTPTVPVVGLLCWDVATFNRLCDRCGIRQRLQGHGFTVVTAEANNRSVAIMVSENAPPTDSQLRALYQAHRPSLVLLLATGESPAHAEGDCILATEVCDARNAVRFDFTTPPLPHVHVEPVGWGHRVHAPTLPPIVGECQRLNLPALAIVRICETAAPHDQQAASLARRGGRLAGRLFGRRGGVTRTWTEYNASVDGIERQLDLALAFLSAT